jgi:hypothetical protein
MGTVYTNRITGTNQRCNILSFIYLVGNNGQIKLAASQGGFIFCQTSRGHRFPAKGLFINP